MRQALQFSAPGEPGGAIIGPGAGSVGERPVMQPQRPMAGPLPGTVVMAPTGVQHVGASGRMPVQSMDMFKNVGRNDPCPCGSGKKFKKCHGAEA